MSSDSLRNYEIRQKLGAGSYGVIYKVLNKVDKSVCVLKQISLTRMNEKTKKNAVNEAHIMGRLKHPFIVDYHSSFIENSCLNILMEFCEGGDLSFFLKQQNKKHLKEDRIWKFFIEVCMGLEYIHRNKILHRDIKTMNIFLNKDETVKIGDLGVAKMLNTNDFAHTMVGTPFYLSPELCEEKPYNEKSDIWAVGCLLYELCTFKHPFEAANQASLILRIVRGKFSPIPEFYSSELKEMIELCLERDYKRRPTAHMILSKPHIQRMVDTFQLNKLVQQFNSKSAFIQQPPKTETKVTKAESKITENKTAMVRSDAKGQQQKQKKIQVKELAIAAKRPISASKEEQNKQVAKTDIKDKKDEIKVQQNILNRRKEIEQIAKALQLKDEKPKVLFGKVCENKNKIDFVSPSQAKIKEQPKLINKSADVIKKLPFEVPIVVQVQQQQKQIRKYVSEKRQLQAEKKESQQIVGSSKNVRKQQSLHRRNSEEIHQVKGQRKEQPKLDNVQKPIFVIKSEGFCIDSEPAKPSLNSDGRKQQKNSQLGEIKEVEKKEESPNKAKKEPKTTEEVIANSAKNIRKKVEEKLSNPQMMRKQEYKIYNYPPKQKKNWQNNELCKRLPKHLPNKQKGSPMSVSGMTQVTKEEQDLVVNLPDSVIKGKHFSDETDEKPKKSQKQIRLKEIDDIVVAQMYEQMLNSEQMRNSEQKTGKLETLIEQQEKHEKQNHSNEEHSQNIEIDVCMAKKQHTNEMNEIEEAETNALLSNEALLSVNEDGKCVDGNFETKEQQNVGKADDWKNEMKNEQQWSFDEQPQLPLMEEMEVPLFEQANPFLIEESEQSFGTAEQTVLHNKKEYLQMKLKENIKREDEINRLMQLRIEECRSVAPKHFEEILSFFRSKINMEKEYTDEDEKEVEQFLTEKRLTDQRKFQNIYKIMHFEMELENTRRIIQSVCKKLNELEKQSE